MTQKKLPITRIIFPEIKLQTRDAHKLRGYFGNLFKDHSPLLHNHYINGELRYRYPLIQYKVIENVPMLIGIEEGAELLPQLFLEIKELDIDNKIYKIDSKNIEAKNQAIGYSDALHSYQFKTLWMALNQRNYPKFLGLISNDDKERFLNKILIGNILSFFRNLEIELYPDERLMSKVNFNQKSTMFKNNSMIAFEGQFTINALLPENIGLGKSVSRGFGTICRI